MRTIIVAATLAMLTPRPAPAATLDHTTYVMTMDSFIQMVAPSLASAVWYMPLDDGTYQTSGYDTSRLITLKLSSPLARVTFVQLSADFAAREAQTTAPVSAVAPIPVPAPAGLLLAGLTGLLCWRSRRRPVLHPNGAKVT